MIKLTEKDRQDILRIISRPPMTDEALDNCPVTKEIRQLKKRVEEERRRDPEKVRARSRAFAIECGMEIVDENHPFHKEVAEKRRKRLAARKAQQESRVPVPATAKVIAE